MVAPQQRQRRHQVIAVFIAQVADQHHQRTLALAAHILLRGLCIVRCTQAGLEVIDGIEHLIHRGHALARGQPAAIAPEAHQAYGVALAQRDVGEQQHGV